MKRIAALLLFASTLSAAEPDLEMQTRIRDEGFKNSKVMEIAAALTDTMGARVTGSPNLKRANEWTRDKLAEFGLVNAHLEPWDFGRGWVTDSYMIRMVTPDAVQLYGIPRAWSPGTNGLVRGKVVRTKLETKEDLDKNRGKYAGMIILNSEPRELKAQEQAALDRYDEKELAALTEYNAREPRNMEFSRRRQFRRALAEWAAAEKVAAMIDPGTGDGGTFAVQQSGSWRPGEPVGVPAIALAPEHYNRIIRLLDAKQNVELELDIRNRFLEEDPNAYNTIAEIPGTDKKGEMVLVGAHLDSWHGSTGATDNAAGVAAIMEAVRILKATGIAPKRTIRIVLWTGEEQGLLGSKAYVGAHYGSREDWFDPVKRELPAAEREKLPIHLKPEQAKVSAYFNMDNGTGKIRGIWSQENAAVMPIFTQWLTAVHDLGATTVTYRETTSTDHETFDDLGIPAFQFIQDQIEYNTRTHHTNWDSYERLQRADLVQASVVVATFLWEAANRPEMLPRKPLPKNAVK